MLSDVIKEGRVLAPNSFIRTKVNSDLLTIEAQAKTEQGWVELPIQKSIPLTTVS
jgi:hypothetical protein